MTTTDGESERWSINNALHYEHLDETIIISLVAASFIGELMMNLSLIFGFFYWVSITPLFFVASVLSEKAKNKRTGRETKNLIKYELFFWGSAFLAVILVVFLWDLERIGPSEASTIIHIILAHTMFLSGIVLGLRFYLIGILLFATATLNITTEFSVGFSLDFFVVIFIALLGLKVKNQYVLPILKRESDFTKSEKGYPSEERRS
jgi:hypothetical protein